MTSMEKGCFTLNRHVDLLCHKSCCRAKKLLEMILKFKVENRTGYVVRRARGEPRGLNRFGNLGRLNLSWPTRVEGEKRLRSETKKP